MDDDDLLLLYINLLFPSSATSDLSLCELGSKCKCEDLSFTGSFLYHLSSVISQFSKWKHQVFKLYENLIIQI